MHDLADLRGGLALQRQPDDLNAMSEHRPDVAEGAAHRDQDVGVGLSDRLQVSRDGARGDEEDAIGKVLGGEEGTLTESLLAEVKNPRRRNAAGPPLERKVIDVAAMKRETDCLLLAVSDRFSGRLVGRDSDQGDLAGPARRTRGEMNGK